jgi:hypothetical protein
MKTLLLILAIALPSFAMANESFEFDTPPAVEKSIASSGSGNELIERDIDELFRRVDELERTKIDAAEAEAIAEKVFKRLSLVVNKADGGQELRPIDVRLGDGSTIKLTLKPGEQISSVLDPSTGQVIRFGTPSMVTVPNQSRPVEQYQFDAFTVRQSQPQPDGTRFFNLRSTPMQSNCQMVTMPDGTVVQQCSGTAASQPARRGLFGNRR